MPRLVLGTRSTPLAVAQSESVAARLRASGFEVELRRMSSQGDRSLGGSLAVAKGMFTAELDDALRSGEVDLVVHSLKDLPVVDEPGLRIVAVPTRAPANDLLVVRSGSSEPFEPPTLERLLGTPADGVEEGGGATAGGETADDPAEAETEAARALDLLAPGALVGTSSPRRQTQLLTLRPDLVIVGLRGSVGRRLERLLDGDLDAILLAEAGLSRLPRDGAVDALMRKLRAVRLGLDSWPCAPGQGALAIQVAVGGPWDDHPGLLALDHAPSRRSVSFERRLLQQLGGGCQMPFGASCLDGRISSVLADDVWRRQAAAGEPPRAGRWHHRMAGEPDQTEQPGPTDQTLPIDTDRLLSEAVTALREELSRQATGRGNGPAGVPTLVVTSEPDAAARLTRLLPAEMTVASFPCTERVVLDIDWPSHEIDLERPRRQWPWVVVSSPTAGRTLVERCAGEPVWGRLPWCALGEGTARALLGLGVPPALVAMARDSGELADFVIARTGTPKQQGKRQGAASPLFVPHSDRASGDLVNQLRDAGREVTAWAAYTVKARTGLGWPESWAGPPSTILFTAGSQVRAFSDSRLAWPEVCWALGEPTAEALAELAPDGARRVAVAPRPTAQGVLDLYRQSRGLAGEGKAS